MRSAHARCLPRCSAARLPIHMRALRIPCVDMLLNLSIPSYTILHHPIPSYTILHHPIPSYTILYHPIPSYTILYHPVSPKGPPYTHGDMYTPTHLPVHVHVYMHMSIHLSMHIYMHTDGRAQRSRCTYAYIRAHVHAHVFCTPRDHFSPHCSVTVSIPHDFSHGCAQRHLP